ncbi:restriction endonuclease subunit S [Xanthomonas nasturtii]|uniref:restriction endonuclease subunit S n=1 Tax=Xanthomonas nasturtii TaxID=1843581 RepID=UPI0020127B7B|nr:restriction endonuclease subunit S [Xanthomonas nasturtii]MCL1501526.1 restriction endonuclease subunit S [Xanthomonas nasturtii]MCL1505439.1 restriction endonuclease subunit S [Xanthomonas nasturtii]MCL1524939.1 restriction endonuclease subunit S [Xanthomonas nasturtii]
MSEVRLGPGTLPIHPEDLPEGWQALQLKSFCDFIQGGRKRLTKQNYLSSGFPAFSAAGQDGFVDVPEFHDTDAVILSAIGANCGRCFLASGDWTTLANVQAVVPRAEQASARFLHYRVNRDDYWPRSGSAQPFIKPSDMKLCWLALPPMPQQKVT